MSCPDPRADRIFTIEFFRPKVEGGTITPYRVLAGGPLLTVLRRNSGYANVCDVVRDTLTAPRLFIVRIEAGAYLNRSRPIHGLS